MMSHLVKLETLFLSGGLLIGKVSKSRTGLSDSMSWHKLALPRIEVIHGIFSLFCVLSALAPFCRALWRKAHGVPCGSTFGAQQQKFEINAPLEGICSFSQLEWNPVHHCRMSAQYLQLKVKNYPGAQCLQHFFFFFSLMNTSLCPQKKTTLKCVNKQSLRWYIKACRLPKFDKDHPECTEIDVCLFSCMFREGK